MAAANTDKFRKKRSNFSTTLNGGISDSDTTIALSSASGLPTDTAVTLTIDRVDVNGVSTPSLRERVTGVISSNNITNALRGRDNTSAASHSSGAVVEDIWDGASWNDSLTGILVEHNQDGTHLNTVVAMLAGSQTFTGAKTFGSALLLATRPKITTSIDDSNGNEIIKTPATSSAVNEITITNSATGNPVAVEASGGDSNINLDLKGKGTGTVRRPVSVSLVVIAPTTDLATGDGKLYLLVPPELNGMNLAAVFAAVITAGTTNTTDIQLARIRSGTPADMLSTKITIDSAETDTSTAATPAVINGSNDDVATNDFIRVDIDAVSTTAPKGLVIRLTFGF